VALPLFAAELGLGAAGVGLIIALPQLSKLCFNLPVGYLIDTIGRKPALLAGGLLDALGQLGTATALSLGQLAPARLLVGFGSATTATSTQAYTLDVVGKYPAHSGLLLGLIQAVGFLAFAIGPEVGGRVTARYGPTAPFKLIAAILLLTTPPKLLLPETAPRRMAEAGTPGTTLVQVGCDALASYAALLADPRQVALLAMKMSFFCGLSLILTIVPLHATAAWDATAADLGRLYSFVTLLSLVVSPLAGLLADRLGKARLAAVGSLSTAVGVALMPLATTKLTYYLARSVWSAGEALLITAYTALALDVTPEAQRGARTSLDNQVGDVALLFLPVLFGVLGSKSSSAAFWLASALMLGCNLVFGKLIAAEAKPA